MVNTHPIDDAFDHVVEVVDRWSTENDLSEGAARLICPTPWVAPQAFLHGLYAPIDDEAIASIANTAGRQPPGDYRKLLSRANGMRVFSGSLDVFGVRQTYARDGAASLFQPFDVGTHQLGLLQYMKADDIIVGAVGDDGDRIVMRAAEGDVGRLHHVSHDVVETWPTLAEFLTSETDRFAMHFDAAGRLRPGLAVEAGKAEPAAQTNYSAIRPRFGSRLWWWDFRDRLLGRD